MKKYLLCVWVKDILANTVRDVGRLNSTCRVPPYTSLTVSETWYSVIYWLSIFSIYGIIQYIGYILVFSNVLGIFWYSWYCSMYWVYFGITVLSNVLVYFHIMVLFNVLGIFWYLWYCPIY